MKLEERVTHACQDDFAVQHETVPETESQGEGHSIQETLEEPLEGIECRVDVEALEVLVNTSQEALQDLVMMAREASQLRESRDEEAMHGISIVRHEAIDGPEHVLLVVKVHHEESRQLRHPLAVTDLLRRTPRVSRRVSHCDDRLTEL